MFGAITRRSVGFIGDIALRARLVHQNPERCWWCLGGDRETREHKFKRTLLTLQFGTGAYDPKPVYFDGRSYRAVRSPDAKALKYEKSLCRRCNNNRSKAMDGAFDRFYKFVVTQAADGVVPASIALADVFLLAAPEIRVNLAATSVGRDLGQASAAAVAS